MATLNSKIGCKSPEIFHVGDDKCSNSYYLVEHETKKTRVQFEKTPELQQGSGINQGQAKGIWTYHLEKAQSI